MYSFHFFKLSLGFKLNFKFRLELTLGTGLELDPMSLELGLRFELRLG